MTKVSIKYNPYKLKTEITVDDEELTPKNKLYEKSAKYDHLKDWIDKLPKILRKQYDDRDFNIEFHGPLLYFEYLSGVIKDAEDRRKITAKCKHMPVKETDEGLALYERLTLDERLAIIDSVIAEIEQGPVEELRDPQTIRAFQLAKNEIDKYSEPEKIKSVYDKFMLVLNKMGLIERLKKALAELTEECKERAKNIESTIKKDNNINEAKEYKRYVGDAIDKINDDSMKEVDEIIMCFQRRIEKCINEFYGMEIYLDDIESVKIKLGDLRKIIRNGFEVKLKEIISVNLTNGERKKVKVIKRSKSSARDGFEVKLKEIFVKAYGSKRSKFSALKYVKNNIRIEPPIKRLVRIKPQRLVENAKKFEYVKGDFLAQLIFSSLQNNLKAIKNVKQPSQQIEDFFNREFTEIKRILKTKILKTLYTDKEKTDNCIDEADKLQWLEQIKKRLEDIVEI
jgi:hypothetical protein